MIKFSIFFLTLFLSGFTLVSDNILAIGEANLVVLSGLIVLDYFDKKSLSLFQVWLVGFIFIIISEVILIEPGTNVLEAVKFLLIANNLIILGYLIPIKFSKFRSSLLIFEKPRSSSLTPYVLIGLVVAYLIYALPGAILTYSLGRNTASGILFEDRNLIFSSFLGALALVLPSIIVFYYKEFRKRKSFLIPLLISLPIFVILFVGGSRFPLLFSLGGFLILSQTSTTGRIDVNLKLIALLLLLVTASSIMGQFRSSGLAGFRIGSEELVSETRLSKRIASAMSSEGVVDMTALSMTYFESNPHTYGKSIAFLTTSGYHVLFGLINRP
jgi:hypothetical protein